MVSINETSDHLLVKCQRPTGGGQGGGGLTTDNLYLKQDIDVSLLDLNISTLSKLILIDSVR